MWHDFQDLEEEMKAKEAELSEMLAKMGSMSVQIGEEPCLQIAELLSQLKEEAALLVKHLIISGVLQIFKLRFNTKRPTIFFTQLCLK